MQALFGGSDHYAVPVGYTAVVLTNRRVNLMHTVVSWRLRFPSPSGVSVFSGENRDSLISDYILCR